MARKIISVIDDRIKKALNKYLSNFIKNKIGTIVAYDGNNYIAYVCFEDGQTIHTYYNKCGEILSDGDNVRVYYVVNIDKGWIGARCGNPKPLFSDTEIDTSIIITQDQNKFKKDKHEIVKETKGDIDCYVTEWDFVVGWNRFYNTHYNPHPVKLLNKWWSTSLYVGKYSIRDDSLKTVRLIVKLERISWNGRGQGKFYPSYHYNIYTEEGETFVNGVVSYHKPIDGFWLEWGEVYANYPTDEEIQDGNLVSYGCCSYRICCCVTLLDVALNPYNEDVEYKTAIRRSYNGTYRFVHFSKKVERTAALRMKFATEEQLYDAVGVIDWSGVT